MQAEGTMDLHFCASCCVLKTECFRNYSFQKKANVCGSTTSRYPCVQSGGQPGAWHSWPHRQVTATVRCFDLFGVLARGEARRAIQGRKPRRKKGRLAVTDAGTGRCALPAAAATSGASRKPAARSPDSTAPSMVAGRPVCVQSPARKKLRHPVFGPGRFASWAGLATIVARFSFTICQGGKSAGSPVTSRRSRATIWLQAPHGADQSAGPPR